MLYGEDLMVTDIHSELDLAPLLPSGLEHLHVQGVYNLRLGTLPPGLKHLCLEQIQALELCALPQSLEYASVLGDVLRNSTPDLVDAVTSGRDSSS